MKMTQNEHTLVALIILTALWYLFIKRYFVTEKDLKEWEEIIKRHFFF
jgi:hypothetical protein